MDKRYGDRTARVVQSDSGWMWFLLDDQGERRCSGSTGTEAESWAVVKIAVRQEREAREAFQAALDDADDAPFRDGGW